MVSSKQKKGKDIWSLTSLDAVAAAIASLGENTNQLQDETWRLTVQTRSHNSLWSEVINTLALDHNEKTRHALYKIWKLNRHGIRSRVEKLKRAQFEDINKEIDMNINSAEELNVTQSKALSLPRDPSLPLPERPITRINTGEIGHSKASKDILISEVSLAFNAFEWKTVFSRTNQEMKENWTKVFYEKLKLIGNTCTVKFKTPYIKKGKRKHGCRFFCCYATCLIHMCPRKYQVILQQQPDDYLSALFLVRILNHEKHDSNIVTASRKLNGEERLQIGKLATEIGPLAVFRQNMQAADGSLLNAGDHTQCPSIEVLKKAASDYRRKMHIDEDIFKDCRILSQAYRKADLTSVDVQGYVQVTGEIPFRLHLYTELQIKRYIDYCKYQGYSYVNIDATGGILKKMHEQKQSLLYALMFKDGTDAFDNVPFAHAILTDNTVPSICYFFSSLAYDITLVAKRLVLPSFFITDFSAAIINAILQAFNTENINTHLKRCWNVVNGNYSLKELRSLCFIHFCCCHVIHAVARSLSSARIDKRSRQAVLYIFAYMICSNNVDELYDTLGLVIEIFSDPNEQNAQKKLSKMLSLELNADEESKLMLSNNKRIFKKAKKNNDKLKVVDEYLRSNASIIHQSPFNQEAVRRFPTLTAIIEKKIKPTKIVNPLFSPSIIRILYRWWAYLPLWTGLLWNFKERYSNDTQGNSLVLNSPVRYSNAPIESYFRTLKKSICKGKKGNRPSYIIMELHRSVIAQTKAKEFRVTQSSKGRKRKKTNIVIEEKWGKRTHGMKGRTVYFNLIDRFASKKARQKLDQNHPDNTIKKYSESEDTTTASSSNQSTHSSRNEDSKYSASDTKSGTSSSKDISTVSREYSIDVPINLDKSAIDNDQDSEMSKEYDSNPKLYSSVAHNICTTNNESRSCSPELVTTDDKFQKLDTHISSNQTICINGVTIEWPKFGVNNVVFDGEFYNLTLTCPLDTALLALFFLYKIDINFSTELDEALEPSPYCTLVKTFNLVEQQGWDAARIYWVLKFNILRRSDRQQKSLFGSVDERVFSFLKQPQRHSNKIICSRSDCSRKERHCSTTELAISSCDDSIEKFEQVATGTCQAMMKHHDEISEDEARKRKYKMSHVPVINCKTKENEYVRCWTCNATNFHEAATFDSGFPPMLIVNIDLVSRKSEEGYEPNPVRLRDLKNTIRVGSTKYRLGATIHNKNAHFTATLIDFQNNLYIYDDQSGIREVRNSSDPIEMGIYTMMHDFD